MHLAVSGAAPCCTDFAYGRNRDCWIQIDLQSVAPGYPVGCVSSNVRFLRCALCWLEANKVARSQEDVKPAQTLLATGPYNIVHNLCEPGQARSVWRLVSSALLWNQWSVFDGAGLDSVPCACHYRERVRRTWGVVNRHVTIAADCVRVGKEHATACALLSIKQRAWARGEARDLRWPLKGLPVLTQLTCMHVQGLRCIAKPYMPAHWKLRSALALPRCTSLQMTHVARPAAVHAPAPLQRARCLSQPHKFSHNSARACISGAAQRLAGLVPAQ
jgi:hypothetical protein